MSFTYDITTEIGKVRALIPDTDSSSHAFEDDEIQFYLDESDADRKLAAALACEVLASNKAKLAKVIDVLDVKVDTTKAAELLFKRSQALREQAEESGDFEIAEMVYDAPSARERIAKERLRSGS